MGEEAARKTTGWLAAAVVVLAVAVTACQPKAATLPGDAAPVGSTSATAEPTSSDSANQPAGGDTPADAVATWVTHILLEEYTEACVLTATVASEETGQDAETLCASDGDAIQAMTQLHEGWAKPGITLPPDAKVEVTEVDAQGDTATVPDTSVMVGDVSLRELELIGATGDTDSFELSLQVRKQDGSWYVAGMNMSA